MKRLHSLLFRKNSKDRAFTLIEIAVVISIITLLALGIAQSASYFRNQANRSLCIVIQKQIQDGVRSIQNLQNLDYGATTLDTTQLWGTAASPSSTAFFPIEPSCPTGTSFTISAPTTIPNVGVEYAICGYTSNGMSHTPTSTSGW